MCLYINVTAKYSRTSLVTAQWLSRGPVFGQSNSALNEVTEPEAEHLIYDLGHQQKDMSQGGLLPAMLGTQGAHNLAGDAELVPVARPKRR